MQKEVPFDAVRCNKFYAISGVMRPLKEATLIIDREVLLLSFFLSFFMEYMLSSFTPIQFFFSKDSGGCAETTPSNNQNSPSSSKKHTFVSQCIMRRISSFIEKYG